MAILDIFVVYGSGRNLGTVDGIECQMDKKKPLTNKEKAFIKLYAKLRNATNAAIGAKYSEDTAGQQGSYLLKKLKVEIQTEIDRQSARIDVEVDDIVRELNILAFSDITNFVTIDEGGGVTMKPIDEIPEIQRRCIESIQEDRIIRENPDGTKVTVHDKIKYKMHSKTKALEMLGKYKAMFTDKIEHSGEALQIIISDKYLPQRKGNGNGNDKDTPDTD